ncbi:MAG: lipoate--protein ligase family protein [Solirubrobacterales bacterium]
MRAEHGELALVRESFPDSPAYGAAVSRAILLRVAGGELPPTMRLHRPGRILAFGRQDAASDRFGDAVRAARGAGFEPIVRLAGGRAAVYHSGTIALSQALHDRRPAAHTHARFERLAESCAAALRRLGVDARVGEVPGEYCPGAWSVNARGRSKLVGIGQRIISGGAHLGVVIVVRDSAAVRAALIPVYEALGLEWDPATAGSVADELGDADLASVEAAILAELERAGQAPVEASLDAETLRLAARLEVEHLA